MIHINLMKFENLAKGKNKYGYVITDDSGVQEYVDIYDSQRELDNEVNMFTIRDIIESYHYELYQDLKNGGEFIFNGRRMYF